MKSDNNCLINLVSKRSNHDKKTVFFRLDQANAHGRVCKWRHRQPLWLRLRPLSGKKTEWQQWFSAWMPRKTHKAHPKRERALLLTVQINLTRNLRYIFTDYQSYRKKKQMDRCNSQKQLDSRQRNMDLQLSFCVKMLDFGVKSYPIVLLYIVLTTHQFNISIYIFITLI